MIDSTLQGIVQCYPIEEPAASGLSVCGRPRAVLMSMASWEPARELLLLLLLVVVSRGAAILSRALLSPLEMSPSE